MQIPLQITFKDIPHIPLAEKRILKYVHKLERMHRDLISCHVVVQQVLNHSTQEKSYLIETVINVPRKQIVANKNPNVNLWKAIRLSFADINIQLKSYNDQLHKKSKTHPQILYGEIVRLFDDFGFILSADGDTEYYFNFSYLVFPKFEKLKIGMPVHFIEFVGDDGVQARRVSARRHFIPPPAYVTSLITQSGRI